MASSSRSDGLSPLKRKRKITDQVAGVLEVLRTNDGHRIVIKHPDLKTGAGSVKPIVLSPRQARHFANLLVMHAEEAEAEASNSSSNVHNTGG